MGCPCSNGGAKSPFKKRAHPPKFGEAGIVSLKYLGEMPQNFRGKVSRKLYVFTEGKPVVEEVDVRDLGGLAAVAGGKEMFEKTEE